MEIAKTTKYFGKVTLEVDDYRGLGECNAPYNGQEVRLAIWGCNTLANLQKNLPFFWRVVDRYAEIYTATKNAIIADFNSEDSPSGGGDAPYFFSELFGFKDKKELIKVFGTADYKQFNIKTFAAKMPCPDLTVHYGYGLRIYTSHIVSNSENWPDYRLCVNMNRNLSVTGFTVILD